MATFDRTFFLNDATFLDDSWDAAATNNNNDVTFRDQNAGRVGGGGGGGGDAPAAQPPAEGDTKSEGAVFVPPAAAPAHPGSAGGFDLTFMDDNHHPSFLLPAPTASLVTPNNSIVMNGGGPPLTPRPQSTGAKRKILGTPEEVMSKRLHARCDESLNASTDIDAVIRFNRIEMERAVAVYQEKCVTLTSLVPIVCDSTGSRYPDPVRFAALGSLAEMLAGNGDTTSLQLVEELIKIKPNILKHLDEVAFRHSDKEQVLTSVFRILSVMAENCFKLLLASGGNNDRHVKNLLKRFMMCDFNDVASKARSLVEKLKAQM